jgi:hypothetical protein
MDSVECIAEVPSLDALRAFKGGEITIQTPKGETTADVDSADKLMTLQMTVQLQAAARELLFPSEKVKSNGKKKSGYVS